MGKLFKKGLLTLTLILGMTFAAPQNANAEGLGDVPVPQLGFHLKNLRLEIINLEGTDIYLMVCIDGDTGQVIWAKTLGGNAL